MRRAEALLFDLDGTLIDSRRDIAVACTAALIDHGHAPLADDVVVTMIGDGARALVARALRRSAGIDDAQAIDALALTFKRRYMEKPCVHTTLLRGAREALSLPLPVAIVTNKPRDLTALILEELGIGKHVKALWGGGDGALKPAPDGIVAVCKALGVAPDKAWMIGDGPQDILAGKAAGAFTVAVPGIASAASVHEALPDLVLPSLVELPSQIEREI